MAKLRRTFGKKATKATARHTARGLSSKAKRKPLRSVTLLGAGAAVGAIAGWFAGRKASGPPTTLSPSGGGQLRPPDAPA